MAIRGSSGVEFLALFSTGRLQPFCMGMLGNARERPVCSSCSGWSPKSVAVSSSEGRTKEESEESAFAAFDVLRAVNL